jgi:CMP-N-acetylneuraminic acid synthetase
MSTNDDKIVALIPARAGSERVNLKNIRPFAGFNGGLLELKLRQLALVDDLNEIIISSNDPVVLDFASCFSHEVDSRVTAIERPDELGRSSTPMSAFISYAATLRDSGVMLMTHVTHPLVTSTVFTDLIAAWRVAETMGHDSLVTVTKLHKFIWSKNGPFNYDSSVEKWPRSQDIMPLFEINHAAYFIQFVRMRELNDRIGKAPRFHELPEALSMDIDWEDQFNLMEDIILGRKMRGLSIF